MNIMKRNFFKSYFSAGSDDNINRTKFIQNRLKVVEKYLPELEKALFEYTDKCAKTRDSSDKIATVLDNYAKAENVTTASKLQLGDFANVLLNVGTCKDAQVHAMENKVLEQLGEYNKLCKLVQNELKSRLMASDNEKSWLQQLKKMRENIPQDQHQISLAEAEFLKARGESCRSSKNLEEQIDVFERKRLNALREALLAWTITELHFHAKALQFFTEAYRIASDIDVNTDVEEFRSKLRSTEDTPRCDSLEGSDSILQLISSPLQRKVKLPGNGIPRLSSMKSSPRFSTPSTVSL